MDIKGALIGSAVTVTVIGGVFAGIVTANADEAPTPQPTVSAPVEVEKTAAPTPVVPEPEPVVVPEVVVPEPAPVVEEPVVEPEPAPVPAAPVVPAPGSVNPDARTDTPTPPPAGIEYGTPENPLPLPPVTEGSVSGGGPTG